MKLLLTVVCVVLLIALPVHAAHDGIEITNRTGRKFNIQLITVCCKEPCFSSDELRLSPSERRKPLYVTSIVPHCINKRIEHDKRGKPYNFDVLEIATDTGEQAYPIIGLSELLVFTDRVYAYDPDNGQPRPLNRLAAQWDTQTNLEKMYNLGHVVPSKRQKEFRARHFWHQGI